MGPHNVLELVFPHAAIGRVVRQHEGDTAQAEDAVGDQHRALLAVVQVHDDVLRARHHYAHVGVVLRSRTQAQSQCACHSASTAMPSAPDFTVIISILQPPIGGADISSEFTCRC